MATFLYNPSDFGCISERCSQERNNRLSKFDRELRSRWDSAVKNGQFRYKLNITKTRITGGKKYVLQLNIPRGLQKRQPKKAMKMSDPFDPQQFNFTKIKESEILMELVKESSTERTYQPTMIYTQKDIEKRQENKDLVIVNCSPFEYGHVLILPDVYSCRPQVLTQDAIELAINTLLLSEHSGFRVGFNSQCASASVNHLHLHGYYVDTELYTESCPVTQLQGPLHEVTATSVKGFVFQLHRTTPQKQSSAVYMVTSYLQGNEIAHNVFMTKGPVFGQRSDSVNRTVRIYIWPRQKYQDTSAFIVGICELSGHFVITDEETFRDLDEEGIEQDLATCALSEADYNKIKENIIEIFQK